jgi:homoserine kinase type II
MAVYTHLDRGELEGFLGTYEVGLLRSFQPIAEGVENSNYRLETSLGRFILTIYEKRVAEEDLPFFLGLMQHLAERGLPCPLPVRDRSGQMLNKIAGKPAALVTYLDGRSPRRLSAPACAALGGALATLHLAGAGFALTRPNALGLHAWRKLHEACRPKAASIEPGLASEIEAELDYLANLWPKHLPAGVIHADLFPDNVFFERDRITGLIDFYFACNDMLAYDLAICLNAWCFETDFAFNVTKARSLLEAYRSHRKLAPDEVAALPVLARGAALRFLMTRLYDWLHQVDGAIVKPKDPREYLRKLRFHRCVSGPEAYGLG